MQQWMEKNKICPMCRAPWVKTPLLQNVNLGELNAEAFEADGGTNARCGRLIRAHVLSDNLQDTLFRQTVRRELIDEAQHLDAIIIAFAYKHTSGPCPLRRFLVDLYALQGNNDWFLDNSLPRVILTDLATSGASWPQLATSRRRLVMERLSLTRARSDSRNRGQYCMGRP
jgi:hypothetical protein